MRITASPTSAIRLRSVERAIVPGVLDLPRRPAEGDAGSERSPAFIFPDEQLVRP